MIKDGYSTSVVFFPQIHNLICVMRKKKKPKKNTENPNCMTFYKYLPGILKSVKIMKDKERLRNSHRLEDSKGT